DHDRPGYGGLGHVDVLRRRPVRQPHLHLGHGRHLHPRRRELPMTAESLGWLGPAPVWGESGVGVESNELLQPFLTELTSDQFVTEFLGVLAGSSPADLATMAPKTTSDGTDTGPYRLYQPLSQRYYLVTASLVCRRVGIPDRAVRRSKGE